MTGNQRHRTAAAVTALLGFLVWVWTTAASAVTPGQSTEGAASSTGTQQAAPPADGCTTTGGAVPESGGWKQEERKRNLQPAQGAVPCTEAGQTGRAKGQPSQ
jgi:hypothetical protein